MAKVLAFILFIAYRQVFANSWNNDDNFVSCDECIRHGDSWCNDVDSDHCLKYSPPDNWCSDNREKLPSISYKDPDEEGPKPKYAQRTIYIGKPNALDISYPKTDAVVNFHVTNSTQPVDNMKLYIERTICKREVCTATIKAMANRNFCTPSSSTMEFVEVAVLVGNTTEVNVKYHVPCACACSSKVDKNSEICSRHGDLSCGACKCHAGRYGEFCDKDENTKDCVEVVKPKRGDTPCSHPLKNNVDCSGNGKCDYCNSFCVCNTEGDGYQYFDQDNFCADICMVTSQCDFCLINNTAEHCFECDTNKLKYNATVAEAKDEHGRKMWITCRETVEYYEVEYVAMRNESGSFIMIVSSGNHVTAGAYTANTKIPIIIGVLFMLACVAVVAGTLLWKHMNAIPTMQPSDMQYQNIGAEDCTGVNPLYKPPTSKYDNPLYGKC